MYIYCDVPPNLLNWFVGIYRKRNLPSGSHKLKSDAAFLPSLDPPRFPSADQQEQLDKLLSESD